jgi:hypothetical protein
MPRFFFHKFTSQFSSLIENPYNSMFDRHSSRDIVPIMNKLATINNKKRTIRTIVIRFQFVYSSIHQISDFKDV